MAYTSPHTARDYLFAACLQINHELVVRCSGMSQDDTKKFLKTLMEIDLCARLASFFGFTGLLSAQGRSEYDLIVKGPTIRAEVKYMRPRVQWAQLKEDWDWLLNTTNNGGEFKKRAWVLFVPSTKDDMHKFTNLTSVPRSHGDRYSLANFAPLVPVVEAEMPPTGRRQRLAFKNTVPQSALITFHGGKTVRLDVVGSKDHPMWCLLYTRVTSTANTSIPDTHKYRITDDAIDLGN